MTQAELETVSEDKIKIVRHVPAGRLKTIVQGYRSVGASKVSSKPEQGTVNEYVVTVRFGSM